MVGPSADLTTEWEGGSLGELVAVLQAAAQPVRIEVIAPGTTDSNAGEVHLLAGGLSDAFAGSLRRDDAMAALQRLEGARFIVEARLPDPETGSLSSPGPQQGTLKNRPVAALMRYCEDYVLTCRLEVWRGQERAVIGYRRGEIVSTSVGGAEGSDRLPEVMAWSDGSYDIVLPPPLLPPTRKGAARSVEPLAKMERKRHATLPMSPSSGSASDAGPAATAASVTVPPAAAARPAGTTPPPVPASAALKLAPAAAQTPQQTAPQPAQPAPRETAALHPIAPVPPARQSSPAGQPVSRPAGPAAQQQPIVRQPVAAPSAPPAQQTPAAQRPLQAAAPPVQPGARVPAPAPAAGQPAPQPTRPVGPAPPPAQGAARAAGPVQTGVPATAGQKPPTTTAGKTPIRAPTPALGSRTATAPKEQVIPELTTRGTPPVPAVPLIPAPAPRPAHQPTPPPLTAARMPAAAKPAGASTETPPAKKSQPAESPAASALPVTPPPFQLAEPVPVRSHKPGQASNDLLPASGTIEAKSRHPNHLPPAAAPIEIANAPDLTPDPQASATEPADQLVSSARPSGARRARVARKGIGEQSVKVYILIGLALGAGVVVAYWAYWYLPFWHH